MDRESGTRRPGALPFSSLIRPEPAPSFPPFDRLAPPPPLNLLGAQIEALSSPGDVVVDLHGRGGWVARTAVTRLRRAYAFESNPLTRLLAEVVLRPPDLRHLDAAFQGIAASPRQDLPLKQALAALFASRCATCQRSVTVEEFIWDGDAEAPFRKTYRCSYCRDQVGGGELRHASTDAADARQAEAVQGREVAYGELRGRFPVLGREETLVDQLLDLFTPRSLVAIHAILQRVEGDLRAASLQAALRLAFLHVLLPASRLSGYPGRVAALRISGARVRLPASRQWRERNPWVLFEDGMRLVRGFIQRLEAAPGGPIHARLGEDLLALADASANVVMRKGSPAAREAVEPLPAEAGPRVRLVLTQPPLSWGTESLSYAYLATSVILGSEAASELPLEPLFGGSPRPEWGWQATALRRSLAAVRPILSADARALVVLDPGGAESLVASVLGGVGAGYRLVSAQISEVDEGIGGTLEFGLPEVVRGTLPRTRANVPLPPLEPPQSRSPSRDEPAAPFQLADVERSVAEIAVEVLRNRGEPARFERLLGEILVGLDVAGHLRRLVGTRTYRETAGAAEARADASGLLGPTPAGVGGITRAEGEHVVRDQAPRRPQPAAAAARPGGIDQVALLLDLIRGELSRSGNRRLVEIEAGRWWLAERHDLAAAAIPLADRVEWAVFSLLSTSGRLSEAALYERIAGIFRGHDAPDEALVRACLESYRSLASTPEMLRTNDDLQSRYADHTAIVADLIDYGHRLGLRVWANRAEQKRLHRGRPLGMLLTERERRAYLPLVVRGPIEALEAVDAIWYLRGRVSFLLEVEWTAMLGEPVLRRGSQIPQDEQMVRFLVIIPERTELVRFKLGRSPVLRAAFEAGNWYILKANHLRRLVERDGASLEWLQPLLGLDPEIETAGEQLALFGPTDATAPHRRPHE